MECDVVEAENGSAEDNPDFSWKRLEVGGRAKTKKRTSKDKKGRSGLDVKPHYSTSQSV